MKLDREVYCILGLPILAMTKSEAVDEVYRSVALDEQCVISTVNINFAVSALSDARFRDSILSSDLVVADGMPLVWLCRMAGIPIRERVAGSELLQRLRWIKPERPLKVYFFGAREGVAEAAGDVLNRSNSPGLVCVGTYFPGFESVELMGERAQIESIHAADPDILILALGAKKGQEWILQNKKKLKTPVISHLGAAIPMLAGVIQQSPSILGRLGLEWLWRIKEEPLLWRRYWRDGLALLSMAPKILAWAACERKTHRELTVTATLVRNDDGPVIQLGTGTKDNIESIIAVMKEAVSYQKDITVDLSDTKRVDARVLGSLLLLSGVQINNDRKVFYINASRSVHKHFEWHIAGYLLKTDISITDKPLRYV